jgi:DNA-binding HxlR family transcriptional regulator
MQAVLAGQRPGMLTEEGDRQMTSQSGKNEPAGAASTLRPAPRSGGAPAAQAAGGQVEMIADWRHLKSWLAAVRGKWDLAVLINLGRGVERPGDLIDTINGQAADDISWKVLTSTLRRLEDEGYVLHKEVSRLPRVTRYWLLPAGRRLVRALTRLDAWFEDGEIDGPPAAQAGSGQRG